MDLRTLNERLAVYLVADPDHTNGDLVEVVSEALAGGVTAVQLRSKSTTDRETLALAERLRFECDKWDALFLINDRVDLALAARAGGVHLGVDDLPVEHARHLGGTEFVIGYSPETDVQTRDAAHRGASYLGVGPVFGTLSKADAGAAIGLETITRRAGLARIPVIGIGGITLENSAQVVAAGAVGVAVLSAILGAADPRAAAKGISEAVFESRNPIGVTG